MGIRGAWSLLCNDPRRFGEDWVCSKDSTIWIDGPSFVYFVALQPRFEQQKQQPEQKQQPGCSNENDDTNTATTSSTTTTPSNTFHVPSNQMGQASPASISKRTRNLISCFANLAKEVHIVMDGLTPIEKIPTQIERLKVAAQLADNVVKSSPTLTKTPPRNCKLISILAEWAVIDTIQQLVSCCGGDDQDGYLDNVMLHRPAFGEAEAFINERISSPSYNRRDSCCENDMSQQQNVVILSNDTDYLVYEHCPGFVPFSSLQFTPTKTGSIDLAGYHYKSCKFWKAFFPNITASDNTLIHTTVAGLAGCDYDDKVLQQTRSKIIKSHLGALRIKHQNKPNSQMTLTAVLRYVAYYYYYATTTNHDHDDASINIHHSVTGTRQKTTTSDQQDQVMSLSSSSSSSSSSWRETLTQSFASSVSLMESLDRVHQCYYSTTSYRRNDNALSIMSETQRLLEFKMIYLKPLLEQGSALSPNHIDAKKKPVLIVRNRKKTTKRSRKRQKKKDTGPIAAMIEPEESTVRVVEEECSAIEYSHMELDEICLDPQPNDQELKLTLKRSSVWDLPQFQGLRVLLYGLVSSTSRTTEGCKNYSISEWRRIGNGKDIDFREFRRKVPSIQVLPMVEALMKGCGCMDHTDSSLIGSVAVTLTSKLLPTKMQWLWLLLLTVPSQLKFHEQSGRIDSDIENVLSVAYFHARLLVEVFGMITTTRTTNSSRRCSDEERGVPLAGNTMLYRCFCNCTRKTLEKFDTSTGSWIWKIILQLDVSGLPNNFFMHIVNDLPVNLVNEWRTNIRAVLVS